ncbi:Bifunctional purine biosynthetic protein ade1 [Coemansia sp. RSA 2523]|nr:Bifunctional purine biosynthetic protein ade1 [Coemansia sp. RSA 1591]KAJ1757495.1 Bifunctional purine biosynthetic protein ade1 [Coemansia sp. RSA 1752]KAJ1775123.1 Bifunctional purine biosynthetic protein ade1 [Coemansia sp. RSA 1824]KAJ1784420.1 Bifunctional purine biosynthetic protein ade1 [Coemansia sp. RSA 1938]KAJ1805479.1 Bifunctional purine biosynthetic protein ade1 [Coemansia sp. RSA 2523]KAJ2132410.1 Bifunctional purine biosynthetic protein ade1 [Coemansia sp. RSA 921]KAJ2141307
MIEALFESNCPDLKLVARGKVRDLYEVDAESLLFVATDRISAYDVIMKSAVAGKGKILTQISQFWFSFLEPVVQNHLITANIDEMPQVVQQYRDQLQGRSLLVKKVEVLPIEAIVRGYITGSGWKEYEKQGTVCDMALPEGLRESQKLPRVLFTPSTKAEYGDHDENIHPDKCAEIIGEERAKEMARVAEELYSRAAEYALGKGIIIADTKFEFGVDKQGNLMLIDEVLTPDSSRFWPTASYKVGRGQESYDKQYLRDYLTSIDFDMHTPIDLPPTVLDNTLKKYIEAYVKLTGNRPELG